MDDLGEWIQMYLTNGTYYRIAAREWDTLEVAFTRWIEDSRNAVLHLEEFDGSEVVTSASMLTDFCLSTPAVREHYRMMAQKLKEAMGFDV